MNEEGTVKKRLSSTGILAGVRRTVEESWQVLLAYGVVVILLLTGLYSSPYFGNFYNLSTLLQGAVVISIVSFAQTLAMISGGVDMSVSSVITLSAIASATIMGGEWSMVAPAILAALGIGLAFGVVNGVVIVYLNVHPFMATLGTMIIGQGLVLIYTRRAVGSIPAGFRSISAGNIGGYVPVALLVIGFFFALTYFLLNHTAFGLHLRAIGGDSRVSHLAGIRVKLIGMVVYILTGLGAALAGIVLISRMGVGSPHAGPGFELDSIIAVILGGTPFGGGRGGVVGTLAGVLILAVVWNLLNIWNMPTWYEHTIRGGILLLAVALYARQT